MTQKKIFRVFALAFAVAAVCGVLVMQPASDVHGEVRPTPVPESFKSGGERSEIVLREISETLKRIDARLAKIEAIAAERRP